MLVILLIDDGVGEDATAGFSCEVQGRPIFDDKLCPKGFESVLDIFLFLLYLSS